MSCETEKQAYDAAHAAFIDSLVDRGTARTATVEAQTALTDAQESQSLAEAAAVDAAQADSDAYDALIQCMIDAGDVTGLRTVAAQHAKSVRDAGS